MALTINTRSGFQVISDGPGDGPLRQDKTAAIVSTDAHGQFNEASSRGFVFTAANVAAQAVSVGLNTTYTGLCISNPVGNNKYFSVLRAQYALSVAPAGIASLHFIAGGSSAGIATHTTPLAAPGIQRASIGPASGLAGQSGSSALADSACTAVNPYYLASVGSGFTAAALYATTPIWVDVAGLITIYPGGWLAWGALTAVTGFGFFAWEEIPIS